MPWETFHFESIEKIYYDVRLIDTIATHFKPEQLPDSKFESIYQTAVFKRVFISEFAEANLAIVGKSIPISLNLGQAVS